tara:strand:- start:209 stop:694 length:486 start_codon:yes stop_codon:yes gene_type:complete
MDIKTFNSKSAKLLAEKCGLSLDKIKHSRNDMKIIVADVRKACKEKKLNKTKKSLPKELTKTKKSLSKELTKTKKSLSKQKNQLQIKINNLNSDLIRLNKLIVLAKQKQNELYNKHTLVSSDGSPENYDHYIYDLTKEYNKKLLLLDNYKKKTMINKKINN